MSFLAQQETKQPEKIINSLYSGFDPSSDSDSYDDDETDGYSVVNGKAVAYPIQDTDTDSDTDDNGKEYNNKYVIRILHSILPKMFINVQKLTNVTHSVVYNV